MLFIVFLDLQLSPPGLAIKVMTYLASFAFLLDGEGALLSLYRTLFLLSLQFDMNMRQRSYHTTRAFLLDDKVALLSLYFMVPFVFAIRHEQATPFLSYHSCLLA